MRPLFFAWTVQAASGANCHSPVRYAAYGGERLYGRMVIRPWCRNRRTVGNAGGMAWMVRASPGANCKDSASVTGGELPFARTGARHAVGGRFVGRIAIRPYGCRSMRMGCGRCNWQS